MENYSQSENGNQSIRWELSLKLLALPTLLSLFSVFSAAQNVPTQQTTVPSSVANAQAFYQALEDSFEEDLAVCRLRHDLFCEGTTLIHIGMYHDSHGRRQKALEYYKKALDVLPQEHADYQRSGVYNDIGKIYSDLGQHQEALHNYEQSLSICRAAGQSGGLVEATILSNMGVAYLGLKQYQQALNYLGMALPIEQAHTDQKGRLSQALTLSSIGAVYADLGDMQKALDTLNQALQALPADIDGDVLQAQAVIRNQIGVVYDTLGQEPHALENFNQALVSVIELGDQQFQGAVLTNLMNSWVRSKSLPLAIFFGKQAVNAYQTVRGETRDLNAELRGSLLLSISGTYRTLADLLIVEGALAEAREVLDLLKDQEYADFTRGDESSRGVISLTPWEQSAQAQYQEQAHSITAIAQRWSELNRLSSRTREQDVQMATLLAQMKAADDKMEDYFRQLFSTIGTSQPANRTVEEARNETAALQNRIRGLTGTVAIYTLVTPDHYRAVVITPNVMVAREYPINYIDLRRKVSALTEDLRDRHSNPQHRAQELYNILVAPIENDLEGAQAKTLVWSLDDALRYLPLAALYDGRHYLVERYRNVAFTASSPYLDNQSEKTQLTGLAMGISKRYDPHLEGLPAVPQELEAIVHDAQVPDSGKGVLTGLIELDDKFTEKMLVQQLRSVPPYSVIHIASHFVFEPGDSTGSYLLLAGKESGGGQGYHLTIDELRRDPNLRFDGAELLVFSACSTATGGFDEKRNQDGREVDSLGILGWRKGAKAVLASLWKVNDASTSLLMADFYRRWITTPGITKASALQQAQLDLLYANRRTTGTHSAGIDYSHPFYWAPFVLMGNWR